MRSSVPLRDDPDCDRVLLRLRAHPAKADDEAAVDAGRKLRMMLKTECDAVPCPQCGALTRQMKEAKAAVVPMGLGGLALGGLIVGGVFYFGTWSGHWFVGTGLVGVGMILWSAFVLLARFWECITGFGKERS